MPSTIKPAHRLATLSLQWRQLAPSAQRRARVERALLSGSLLCAAALLATLATVCQESVQRGERFRATQNAGTQAVVAAAAGRPLR